MAEIEELKKEIDLIKEGNKRVEADKAWEISLFHIIFIRSCDNTTGVSPWIQSKPGARPQAGGGTNINPRILRNVSQNIFRKILKRYVSTMGVRPWISISAITYIITAIVFYFIGVKNFLLSALIPTVGYCLSTQSLPFIKKFWTEKLYKE